MTKKVRIVHLNIVAEVFQEDPINRLHKDLYESLVDASDDVCVGDFINIETGEKIIQTPQEEQKE